MMKNKTKNINKCYLSHDFLQLFSVQKKNVDAWFTCKIKHREKLIGYLLFFPLENECFSCKSDFKKKIAYNKYSIHTCMVSIP